MNFWDENAFDYDRRHEAPRTLYLRKIERKFLKYCFGKIADLGCGTGWPSLLLAKKGFPVYCFDSSTEMLKILKEKADREGVKLNIVNHDCTKPFAKQFMNYFDTVISFLSFLNYVKDYKKTLENMMKILKNKAMIILSVATTNETKGKEKTIVTNKKKIKIYGINVDELSSFLEKFGFKLIKSRFLFALTDPKWNSFEKINLKEKLLLFLERFQTRKMKEKARIAILAFRRCR